MAQLQARKSELKKRNDSLEQELATEKVAREVTKKESTDPLSMMKNISIDANLHACAELC